MVSGNAVSGLKAQCIQHRSHPRSRFGSLKEAGASGDDHMCMVQSRRRLYRH